MLTTADATIAIVEPAQPNTVHSPMSAIRVGLAGFLVALCLIPLVGSGGDTSVFRDQFTLILNGLPRWLLDVIAGA